MNEMAERSTRKMYVIDDESLVNELMCSVGEMLGYEVKAFTSAQDFLDLDPSEDPDLLLIDIFMPGLDGFELLGKLNKRGLASKVMIMTGKGKSFLDAAMIVYEGHGIDVVGEIAKPCSVQEIMNALDMDRVFADEVSSA